MGQRMGVFGTFRNFVGVLREVSFDELREQAELVPRVLVVAPDEAAARRLGEALVGGDGAGAVTARGLEAGAGAAGRFDAVVVHDPGRTGALERLRGQVPAEAGPPPVFAFEGTGPEDEKALEALRRLMMDRLPDRAPAFGRAFRPFRDAAVRAVVDETSKANAQFALVSNIPAVVPIIGSLAAAGADFLVLTKNQVLLMFKIAAIHGRDLHDHWGIMRELMPVVGAGLFWRTVAREMASFIPFAAGTVPKVAIAYAGTVAVGRGADFFYQTSRKPSREQFQGYYRQAAEAVRKLPLPLPGGEDDKQDAEPIDRAASQPAPVAEEASGDDVGRGDAATSVGAVERAATQGERPAG
jgi:uncharacterized protein (DUF697 family)